MGQAIGKAVADTYVTAYMEAVKYRLKMIFGFGLCKLIAIIIRIVEFVFILNKSFKISPFFFSFLTIFGYSFYFYLFLSGKCPIKNITKFNLIRLMIFFIHVIDIICFILYFYENINNTTILILHIISFSLSIPLLILLIFSFLGKDNFSIALIYFEEDAEETENGQKDNIISG